MKSHWLPTHFLKHQEIKNWTGRQISWPIPNSIATDLTLAEISNRKGEVGVFVCQQSSQAHIPRNEASNNAEEATSLERALMVQ